jgi:hypothetical protein
MRQTLPHSRGRVNAFLLALVISLACRGAHAGVTVLGVQYQQDQPYPEFNCIWNDKTYPTNCPARSLGCNVHVYLKNTGGSSVTISDVTVAGYSLADSLVENAGVHYSRSIYFKWDNPPSAILNAGEPVWYKGDPATIPAGGVGQAVLRLRSVPVTQPVSVGVVTSGGTVTTNITVDMNAPQLASIGYSPDLTKVYLHWRRNGGAAPTTVKMDGVDVTPATTTVGDPTVNFGASIVQLAAPLVPMSYHVFQGAYSDGKLASASQRAWTNKFIYASYGNFETSASYTIADWVAEASEHGFNNCQVSMGEVGGYMWTGAGQADCRARGYGYTSGDKTKFNPIDPDMFFLNDEPDAEEANMENTFCGTGLKLPCGHSPMGILVMREIANGEGLRALRPMTPTSINLNGTFRPENYYAWGQSVDILQVDPYYQRRLSDVYWRDQYRIPLYRQATYIYAVSRAVTSAAEPNPSNVLLYSCEWKCTDDNCDTAYVGQVWPFPTTEAKRIEVYYALAAGVKGMGYWWFPKGYPSNGLADQGKATARALWKELGLLGNEIKAAQPLLVTSHPVDMTLSPGTNVWVRALASGTDTILLIVVNDDYYNDEAGCHYTPVANATLTATLPSWMQASPTAFAITAGGLTDVSTVLNGNQLQVNLGVLNLTRMIVLTKTAGLRATIQQRYDQQVRPGICAMAPELCANTPPSMAQQPVTQYAAPGGAASFTVVTSGSNPLGYQWQKDAVKLNNGGHYSGCTAATLMVNGADTSDVAGYRCVVTNAYGSVTSSVAMLLLGAPCSTPGLLNANFEGTTNAPGVSTNWVGYQRAPNPSTVWSIQTAAPNPPGGALQYQQIANTSGTGGGGVRQDITGCVVGATYQISGWLRGNSVAYSTCTVKVSPSASTNWSTAIDLNPPQTYTGNTWTNFSGTVVATGPSMTLWLDGQTGGTGQNKAECFDAVTVTCLGAPPALRFESAGLVAPNLVRLVLSGEPGKTVTVRRSSNLASWVVVTNLVNSNGIVQFTEPTAGTPSQRFYRATSP